MKQPLYYQHHSYTPTRHVTEPNKLDRSYAILRIWPSGDASSWTAQGCKERCKTRIQKTDIHTLQTFSLGYTSFKRSTSSDSRRISDPPFIQTFRTKFCRQHSLVFETWPEHTEKAFVPLCRSRRGPQTMRSIGAWNPPRLTPKNDRGHFVRLSVTPWQSYSKRL